MSYLDDTETTDYPRAKSAFDGLGGMHHVDRGIAYYSIIERLLEDYRRYGEVTAYDLVEHITDVADEYEVKT